MFTGILSGVSLNARTIWLGLGFAAQALFASRFVVQWLASEKAKTSVVPIAFWYLSLSGGLLLLAYSIYRRDPVFIAGQALGTFIYVRNLFLIRRSRGKEMSAEAA